MSEPRDDGGQDEHVSFRPVHQDADDDAVADAAADLIDYLRDELRRQEREIETLQGELRRSQLVGVAVGVLLAREPSWDEHDAWAAWEDACARLTRGGSVRTLANHVIETGRLP